MNIVLAGLGANHGIVKNFPFLFGVTSAVAAVSAACLLGFQVILENPLVHHWIGIAGAAYILYLSVKLYRLKPARMQGGSVSHGFTDGFLATVLNPKFYVMVTSVFAQFLSPEKNNSMIVWAAFCVFLFAANSAWLCLGKALGSIGSDDRYLPVVNKIMGASLFAFAIYFLYDGITAYLAQR